MMKINIFISVIRIFSLSSAFSEAGRFRRRSFHKPNLIRIKADPNNLDQLN